MIVNSPIERLPSDMGLNLISLRIGLAVLGPPNIIINLCLIKVKAEDCRLGLAGSLPLIDRI